MTLNIHTHLMGRTFQGSGVRLLPGFHGDRMEDARLESLCHLLKELCLSLFLTLRMEDERITYLMQPQDIPLWDLSMFAAKYQNICCVMRAVLSCAGFLIRCGNMRISMQIAPG